MAELISDPKLQPGTGNHSPSTIKANKDPFTPQKQDKMEYKDGLSKEKLSKMGFVIESNKITTPRGEEFDIDDKTKKLHFKLATTGEVAIVGFNKISPLAGNNVQVVDNIIVHKDKDATFQSAVIVGHKDISKKGIETVDKETFPALYNALRAAAESGKFKFDITKDEDLPRCPCSPIALKDLLGNTIAEYSELNGINIEQIVNPPKKKR